MSRFFALCCFIFSFSALAQTGLQLVDNHEVVRLSKHLTFLQEDDKALTVFEAQKRLDQFEYRAGDNPNYGFQTGGLWLHTSFINLTKQKYWVVDLGYSQLEKVDIYLFSNGQLHAVAQQGKSTTNHIYRFPTLATDIPFAETIDLFVRIESATSSLIAPIDIQPSVSHVSQTFLDTLMWGVFYGGLLILAIYNLVIYFNIKEFSLLTYVGYIITVIIWQLVWGGHLLQLAPHEISVWLNMHSNLVYVLIGLGSGAFTFSFLEVKVHAPKTRYYLLAFLVALALSGIISALDLVPSEQQNTLIYLLSLGAITSFMAAGFEAYFNQFKPARYFIFAWSILYGCALIGMLSLIEILPSNFFTTYCFQFGVFFEAGLFSLALMEKSRDQLEREIDQATVDLRNNMELVEEQNARLDIARKDAIQASHVKSQFLANMSHEIRTPLNAILGFSRELSHSALQHDTKEQVKMINTAATSLLSVVNDVLDFSKIEAGKLELNNHPFAPHQMLEEIVGVMSRAAQTQGLEFCYHCEPLPEKLYGDDFRISQVLNNLLSNAVKFTESGHVALKVSCETSQDNMTALRFVIEDTGIGISHSEGKKLFSAFSQLDDALNRSYQGTGLGLVICQELVKLMRGTINFTSVKGQGTCFEVTIHLNQLSHHLHLVKHKHWQSKNVLLFNPSPLSRRNQSSLLKQLGANVNSIESLAGLRATTDYFDVLVAALPQSHLTQRDSFLMALNNIKATEKIMLYSGPNPSLQFEHFGRHYHHVIRLPLTANKLQTLSSAEQAPPQNLLQQKMDNLPAANILAVDDMPMNLKLLSTWLKNSKVNLTLAHSGSEAVSLAEKQDYDLILMDVQMPDIDGLQASKLIRKTQLNFGTPIIAVTAHAFKEEQEQLLASGMDDYLAKPIDPKLLLDQIALWCENAQHNPATLPSFDWQVALGKANQNEEAAQDYLADYLAQLNDAKQEMKLALANQDYPLLLQHIHKLNGASSYTGVVKLKTLCDTLEGKLKLSQLDEVSDQLEAIFEEMEQAKQAAADFL